MNQFDTVKLLLESIERSSPRHTVIDHQMATLIAAVSAGLVSEPEANELSKRHRLGLGWFNDAETVPSEFVEAYELAKPFMESGRKINAIRAVREWGHNNPRNSLCLAELKPAKMFVETWFEKR